MAQEFSRDIEDSATDVFVWGDELRLDGGNWDVIVVPDGRVATNLPMNAPDHYDEETDPFLDNVLGPEVYESRARSDACCDGPIVPVSIAPYPAVFLLVEVSLSVNAASAGGNASLMTIG